MTQSVSVDLTSCDREPIHLPGSIQPHGVMLVCESESARIVFASANAAQLLGRALDQLLGRTLVEVLGEQSTHDLRNALAKSGATSAGAALVGLRLGATVFDVIAHRHDERLIIELEPAHPSGSDDVLATVQALVRRISLETDVIGIAAAGARLVRALLGYDRVMIYRFLHNDAGQVIAEAKRPDLHSFLDQHFPASDIPLQARRLYLQNWIRLIADVNYAPVPLVAATSARGAPVDMSYAHLRSVSPIHCEYLRNMGVAASLSISIVVDGRLWGLIACHHDSPRTTPLPLRAAAEIFGQYFSLQMAAAERRAELQAARQARQRLDCLARQFTPDQPVEVTLRSRLQDLADLISCDGAALWFDGAWTAIGSAPRVDDIRSVLHKLAQQEYGAVWDTDELPKVCVEGMSHVAVAGMLAVPISARARDYLLLFRQEQAQSVTWAGAPHKQEIAGPHGMRLTPRGSFDAWREEVRGRARPWTDAERAVAEAIKTFLRDIVLRRTEQLEAERLRVEQRRRMLNDELHHRVKNILALVKSIASQTGAHAANVAEYSAALEGRFRALSHAHDHSLAIDVRGDLHALLDAEACLYRGGGGDERIAVSGPRLGFTEDSFGSFALVIHEMMTNAAKYGALSTSEGRLSVDWSLNPAGDCNLYWVESGGPAVAAPTRTGFGSTLIDSAVTYDLGGEVSLQYTPVGLRANFVIPARHIMTIDESGEIAPLPLVTDEPARAARPLTGLTVLLVEDKALIALDAESVLHQLGAATVTCCPSVATALQALARHVPNVVVLDFNLGGETSVELADWLVERNVPFVFLTGYADKATIPPRFATTPVIHKPIDIGPAGQALVTALQLPTLNARRERPSLI
jgi:light-regulated signal transduction histidine kinase (bacteriophytochrome)